MKNSANAIQMIRKPGFTESPIVASQGGLPRWIRVVPALWGLAASTAIVPILTAQSQTQPVLKIQDLTPKFLTFYQAVDREHAGPTRRWELWKQMYGFAAVPPTPEGDQMARKMLDDAWPRYKSALPIIKRGVENLQPPPSQILDSVAQTLGVDVPVRARLLLFVGGFDNNAFTSPGNDGVPTVALPVEGTRSVLVVTHEFTHVVEAEQAHLSLEWKRSIAHTIFVEGLAMRVTQHLNPGLPDKDYVGEFSSNWFARADSQRNAILKDLAPHLSESDEDSVLRYTMGKGGVGIEREAYYAGWLVIGNLLERGWTFPRLARVRDDQMERIVSDSITQLQKAIE